LILKEDDFDIVACPLFRFFNNEQVEAAKIDWDHHVCECKLDGTCIILYNFKNKWFVATRSRPEADVPVDESKYTFTDLVNKTLKIQLGHENINEWMNDSCKNGNEYLKHMTFVFELCSPVNRIVCEYNDFSLTLLAVRDNVSLQEEDPKIYSDLLKIPVIETYDFKNITELIAVINTWDPRKQEGVVVKDRDFNRIKVKSIAYKAINRMRDRLSSIRGCMEVVLLGKDDDIITMVPEFIKNRIVKLKETFAKVILQTNQDYKSIVHIDDMKEFAFAAKTKIWPAALFALKRNKTPDLLTFAQGDLTVEGGISNSKLDTVIELCSKIDFSIHIW